MKRAITATQLVCFLGPVLLAVRAFAQETPTVLRVQLENWVNYVEDVTESSNVARSAGPVAWMGLPVNFIKYVSMADITAVNGVPAKGTYASDVQILTLTPDANPGQAVADVVRNGIVRHCYEFLKSDGSSIGTIFSVGLTGGIPPPGMPEGAARGNFAIIGGTGAFVGVRGTINAMLPQSSRNASQSEDPSRRRINGGGNGSLVFQIWPMFRPEVSVTPTGPAVFHSDFTAVSPQRPAQRGETLILYARGLGPTNPVPGPGEPFPKDPLAVVTSPVEVLIDGTPSSAINQVGVPGTIDTYRIDFRVPDISATATATIQLTAAWLKGTTVRIPVR